MGILSKIFTAVRGGASEAGQKVVDHQALRILDQEIRDADNALSQSRTDLARLIAERRLADGKIADIDARVSEYERHASAALDKGEETLAAEVAERIAQLESERAAAAETAGHYEKSEQNLRDTIRKTEMNLRRMKSQVDTVKATASVQRAQAAVASRHSGAQSRMQDAMDSLQRIKERQTRQSAQFEAAEELQQQAIGSDLDAKLAAAGIGSAPGGASAVLERLKAKRLGAPAQNPALEGPSRRSE